MFASNFPVDNIVVEGGSSAYDALYTAYKQIVSHLPTKHQAKLFHTNAIKYYRLYGSNQTVNNINSATNIMRYVNHKGETKFGQLVYNEDDSLADDSDSLSDSQLIEIANRDAHRQYWVHVIEGDIYGKHVVTQHKEQVVQILPPVDPYAIILIGLNYKAHASESQIKLPIHPVVFAKFPNAVTGSGSTIVIPKCCQQIPQVDYEVEMAIVIGRLCKDVSEGEALNYVLGFTPANDVSARVWQIDPSFSGGQWVRGKTFDTFCPLGPTIRLAHTVDHTKLTVATVLNGSVVQHSSTSFMLFNVARLVSFLSQGTTLNPGTVILTGTPEGCGFARKPPLWLKDGDSVTVYVQSCGACENPVRNQ